MRRPEVIESGKERGYVAYDDLNKACHQTMSSEQIEHHDPAVRVGHQSRLKKEADDADDANDGDPKPASSGKAANDDNQDWDAPTTCACIARMGSSKRCRVRAKSRRQADRGRAQR